MKSAVVAALQVASPRRTVTSGLLQRQCACGSRAGSSGECEGCNKKRTVGLQTKMQVGFPGDMFEQEADRAADQVLSHPQATAGTLPAGTLTTLKIQRRNIDSSSAIEQVPTEVDAALAVPGRPLDPATQKYFEPRFGHDFSRVRIHVDNAAAASVSAHAFTVGERIVFAANQYQPTTHTGRHLLAHELTHVVQQSSPGNSKASHAGNLQRKGSGLLPPEKVDEIYSSWLSEYLKNRGAKTRDEEEDVRERVKKQVGPTNFANWERWDQAQVAKIGAEAEAAKPKPFDPDAGLLGQYEQMWKDTENLRNEVWQTEGLAMKLNFGGGVKGSAARIGAGGYTAMWGIGGRTVTSVAEHGPMLALGTVGMVFGSELAGETLTKHAQAIKQEGEEMDEDARTAERLVAGDLQAAYEATRPSYKKYQTALGAFGDARAKFKEHLQLDGNDGYFARARDIGAMDAAMKDMRETGKEFLMACAKMGIQTDARALDKMGDNIVNSAEGTVATAVTALFEIAPGLAEIKSALKPAEGMGAKQLEKEAADQVAASIAKTGDDAAISSGSKSVAKTGKDVTVQKGVPVEVPAAWPRPVRPGELKNTSVANENAIPPSHPAVKAVPESPPLKATGTDDVVADTRPRLRAVENAESGPTTNVKRTPGGKPAKPSPKVELQATTMPSKGNNGPPIKKSYYGGGGGEGRRKRKITIPKVEVEKAPQLKTPAAKPSTDFSDTERAMVSEAERAFSRLGKPLKVKTKSAAKEGGVERSGSGKQGGGEKRTQKVMDTGKEIGHEFPQNSSLDNRVPGSEKAGHAEKLAAINNPGKALAVDRAMCLDCFAFFQKLAKARGTSLVVQEPTTTWVFRPDGVRVGLPRGSQVKIVMHPDGSASAGSVP